MTEFKTKVETEVKIDDKQVITPSPGATNPFISSIDYQCDQEDESIVHKSETSPFVCTYQDRFHSKKPAQKCVKGPKNENIFKGTFSMGSGDYLYHGSPDFFGWPFDLQNIDNRLSPSMNIAFQYATKKPIGEREGFVYQYVLNPSLVDIYGGIPNVLFACGRWSEISDRVEQELKNPRKILPRWQDSKYYSPASLFKPQNTRPDVELLYKFMTMTNYWGVYTPGYENQIVLRPTKNLLKCVGVYFVKKEPRRFEKQLDDQDFNYIVQNGFDKFLNTLHDRYDKWLNKQVKIEQLAREQPQATHKRKRQDDQDDDAHKRNVRPRF